MNSVLTKKQTQRHDATSKSGQKLVLELQYDDNCGNGHNTFGMGLGRYRNGEMVEYSREEAEIKKYFPQFLHLLEFHLFSTDGPMHYVANTLYHASTVSKHHDWWSVSMIEGGNMGAMNGDGVKKLQEKYGADNIVVKESFNTMAKEPDIEAARSCACWPNARLEQLQDTEALESRLPALLVRFKAAMESVGFTY